VSKALTAPNTDLADVVGAVVRESGKLIGQQVDLFRAEAEQELRRAAGAGATVVAGGGLAAAGLLMSGPMLAHLLHRATGLPLWCCYGVAGGALVATGATLVRAGGRGLAGVRLLPQTTETAGENLTWLKEQLTPGPA
jgi:hypothetical protein